MILQIAKTPDGKTFAFIIAEGNGKDEAPKVRVYKYEPKLPDQWQSSIHDGPLPEGTTIEGCRI